MPYFIYESFIWNTLCSIKLYRRVKIILLTLITRDHLDHPQHSWRQKLSPPLTSTYDLLAKCIMY